MQTKPDNRAFLIAYFFLGMMMIWGSSSRTYSQFQTGTNISTYAGVNNVFVNPALLSNSRYYVDINVISGGSFIHNNYAYLARKEYNFLSMLNPSYRFPMHDKEYGQGERPAYTVEEKKPKDFLLNSHIIGPSVMIAMNDHILALQTSFRSVNSFRDIPYDMANYFYYSLDYKPQHGKEFEHRDPIKFATLTWSEIGLSWAYTFSKYNRDRWSFGISAKMLLGHAGSYVYLDHLKYFTPDDETVYIRNVNGEAAYSLPVDYSITKLNTGTKVRGYGMGFDLGVSYIHTKKGHSNMKYKRLCAQRYEDYKYKIGISLMDFGWIRFTEQARKYEYHNEQGYWDEIDTLDPYYDNFDYISEDISMRLCGSPDCAKTADAFSMFLPATLGLQFDYHYVNNWYISSSLRLPLNFAKNQVRYPSSVVIAPRMETQVFEMGIPFTLYDMRYPMLGAFVRFYNITVGTDNLSGFFNLTNHYGFDLYVSVKINFIKNRCKKKLPRFCIDDFRFKKYFN